jgi:hypothetical protein
MTFPKNLQKGRMYRITESVQKDWVGAIIQVTTIQNGSVSGRVVQEVTDHNGRYWNPGHYIIIYEEEIEQEIYEQLSDEEVSIYIMAQ